MSKAEFRKRYPLIYFFIQQTHQDVLNDENIKRFIQNQEITPEKEVENFYSKEYTAVPYIAAFDKDYEKEIEVPKYVDKPEDDEEFYPVENPLPLKRKKNNLDSGFIPSDNSSSDDFDIEYETLKKKSNNNNNKFVKKARKSNSFKNDDSRIQNYELLNFDMAAPRTDQSHLQPIENDNTLEEEEEEKEEEDKNNNKINKGNINYKSSSALSSSSSSSSLLTPTPPSESFKLNSSSASLITKQQKQQQQQDISRLEYDDDNESDGIHPYRTRHRQRYNPNSPPVPVPIHTKLSGEEFINMLQCFVMANDFQPFFKISPISFDSFIVYIILFINIIIIIIRFFPFMIVVSFFFYFLFNFYLFIYLFRMNMNLDHI